LKEVNRFGLGLRAVSRSYAADLNPCIAAAPSEDRNAIREAMGLT
jgi:hypothetical protein